MKKLLIILLFPISLNAQIGFKTNIRYLEKHKLSNSVTANLQVNNIFDFNFESGIIFNQYKAIVIDNEGNYAGEQKKVKYGAYFNPNLKVKIKKKESSDMHPFFKVGMAYNLDEYFAYVFGLGFNINKSLYLDFNYENYKNVDVFTFGLGYNIIFK